MTDTYRGGYKKALLDIFDLIYQPDPIFNPFGSKNVKSKKQYEKQLQSLLHILLSNPTALDSFMEGTTWFKINPKGELIKIAKTKEELK